VAAPVVRVWRAKEVERPVVGSVRVRKAWWGREGVVEVVVRESLRVPAGPRARGLARGLEGERLVCVLVFAVLGVWEGELECWGGVIGGIGAVEEVDVRFLGCTLTTLPNNRNGRVLEGPGLLGRESRAG
jgi:hypothetical protein